MMMGHGLEFHGLDQLQKVIGVHPTFSYLKRLFGEGMEYVYVKSLTEEQWQGELQAQLIWGNHPSAVKNADTIRSLLKEEVHHSFAILVDPTTVPLLKVGLVQPCCMVRQFFVGS